MVRLGAAMELKRDIGALGVVFIALNGMVGAGIFALPQALAAGAGATSPYLILAFGAAMIPVALVFGALAGRFDNAGGMVVYVEAAFGRFASFQAGWLYYLARLAAVAANTNVLLTYLAVFTPGIDQGVWRVIGIITLLAALTTINIRGVKGAVRALNLVTLLKLAPLIVLVGWGLAAFSGHVPAPAMPTQTSTSALGLLVLYAFVGFESATLMAGETRDAKKTLPRALVAVIATMTVLYFLVQLAYVAIMQGRTPEIAPLAAAAQVLAGPWGAGFITVAAIFSIGGNLFSAVITTPRVTFAMAREHALPSWFGAVHAHFATPANSILFLGVLGGALAVSGAFAWLAAMSALARMLVYLGCAGALAKLPAPAPGLSALATRFVAPLAAGGLCIWAAAQAKPDAWAFLAGFALLGAALYVLSHWLKGARQPI